MPRVETVENLPTNSNNNVWYVSMYVYVCMSTGMYVHFNKGYSTLHSHFG